MIYAIAFYWVVAGLVTFWGLDDLLPGHDFTNSCVGLIFGGVIVPALLLRKAIQ